MTRHVSRITFIKHVQSQIIGKPHNLIIFGSKNTNMIDKVVSGQIRTDWHKLQFYATCVHNCLLCSVNFAFTLSVNMLCIYSSLTICCLTSSANLLYFFFPTVKIKNNSENIPLNKCKFYFGIKNNPKLHVRYPWYVKEN